MNMFISNNILYCGKPFRICNFFLCTLLNLLKHTLLKHINLKTVTTVLLLLAIIFLPLAFCYPSATFNTDLLFQCVYLVTVSHILSTVLLI